MFMTTSVVFVQLCRTNLQVEVVAPKFVLDETAHAAYRHERIFMILYVLSEQCTSCKRIDEMTNHIVQRVKPSSFPFILIIFLCANQFPLFTFNTNAL